MRFESYQIESFRVTQKKKTPQKEKSSFWFFELNFYNNVLGVALELKAVHAGNYLQTQSKRELSKPKINTTLVVAIQACLLSLGHLHLNMS